jgi:lipid II:glycine glycyltransferase (peptidoglycan interpeptide bridge formation enzyme)
MDKQTWNEIIKDFPHPQVLQTWEWGEVKAQFGWKPHHKTWEVDGEVQAVALVLERSLNLPGMAATVRMLYVPKGPLLRDWGDAALRKRVLANLRAFAKQRRAFLLKIDPDAPLGYGLPGAEDAEEGLVGAALVKELKAGGWRYSAEQIQFKNTVFVDLTQTEEEILARMKQKTRYNVRLAGRKGVEVRRGTVDDLELLYKMYAETAVRDGFTIRGWDYYKVVWETFMAAEMLTPLIAEVEGEAVAGLMAFHVGRLAWYLYGMSTEAHRKLMPTYALQWEAMCMAKEKGCQVYDMWGAPEVFEEADSLWGVYRFKDGFGGRVARHVGAWDLPLRPWLYRLYTQVLPRVIETMRRKGDAETRGQAGGGI